MCEIDSTDLFDTKDEGAPGELRWALFEVKQHPAVPEERPDSLGALSK